MKKIKIDLNEIEGIAFALGSAKDKVTETVKRVASEWGKDTQINYDNRSGHAVINGQKSFSEVTELRSNGLRVSVGHESFIARFLEVGTKNHPIPHRQGKGWAVANVKGIKGNKALSKAVSANKGKIIEVVEHAINDVLKNIVIFTALEHIKT